MKVYVLFKRPSGGDGRWFELVRPHFRFGGGHQFVQIGHMISVGMREKDVSEIEVFGVQGIQHGSAVGAGVECSGLPGPGVPYKITVHGHVFERRIKGREARGEVGLSGIPGALRHRFEGIRTEAQVAGDTTQHRNQRPPLFDGRKVRQANLRPSRQILVRDVQPTLSFIDDVGEIIFERDTGHVLLRWSAVIPAQVSFIGLGGRMHTYLPDRSMGRKLYMVACYSNKCGNADCFMVTDKIKTLAITRARVAELEKSIAAELNRELAALPDKYGFDSLPAFFDAVRAASRGKTRGRAKTTSKAASGGKRRKRAVITAETKAKVKSLVESGKTGAEIAKQVGISLPSVQNIKKDLGLVKARK